MKKQLAQVNRKLKKIETRMEDNQKRAWYENGLLLWQIQEQKLYKGKYSSFENYVSERWDFEKTRATRLISAAKTYQLLEKNTLKNGAKNDEFGTEILPKNEAQIRPLLQLENDSQRVYVWNHLVEAEIKPTMQNVSNEVKQFLENPVEVDYIDVEVVEFITDSKDTSKIEKRKKEYTEATVRSIEHNKPVIYRSDCIDYMSEMNDNSVDLLITDTPYSTDIDDIDGFAKEWLEIALKKVKPTGRAYICIGAYPKEVKAYFDVLLSQDKFIVDNPLIWTYKNTLGQTPKMKYNLNYQMIIHLYTNESKELDTSITNEMFSVQEINAPDGRLGDRYHTWQKPDELAYRLINHSTLEGETVFDPFSCTGTFLIAGAKFNRRCYGCELSEDNAKIAEERGCHVVYN